jgi:hypothetical protein
MAKLTRDLFIPLIDRNKLTGAAAEGFDWVRVDKSTVFALAFNPQEETFSYIDAPNDATEISSYRPELPQEIVLDSGNPLYVAMHDFCMSMPIGSDAEVPCLLVMPDSSTGEATKGYLWEHATISPTELNSVDGKLTFSMKLNGVKKNGTVTASGGTFVFAEA